MAAVFSSFIVRGLSALGMLVLLLMGYFQLVYMPQQKLLDEQQEAIQRLEDEVDSLREMQMALGAALSEGSDPQHLRKLLKDLHGEGSHAPDHRAPGARDGGEEGGGAEGSKSRPRADSDGRSGREGGSKGLVGHPKHGILPAPAPAPLSSASKARYRSDERCGKSYPAPDGKPAACNPKGAHPCCAPSGWCGSSPDHCRCKDCIDYNDGLQEEPAEDGGYNELKAKSIAIVVPFRDRGAHLERFRARIRALIEAWASRGANHSWTVVIAEQFDNRLFNRGYLFNAGFQLAASLGKRAGKNFDCVVMHDIDILPEPNVDYGWCKQPIQLSGEISCWQNSVPYPDNVGGVVSMSPSHWQKVNGFSNEYEGWGGEDDDLYLRLKQTALLKGKCHTWCSDKKQPSVPMVMRPPLGKGKFICLHDGDHTPRQRASNDAAMWNRLKAMKSNSRRWQEDGISNVKIYLAARGLESKACVAAACSAPNAVVKKPWPFAELWARVSSKAIPSPSRIRVAAPLEVSPSCRDVTKALPEIPDSLGSMRRLLLEFFGGECGLADSDATTMEFGLIDMTNWQVLLVGPSAKPAVADSSLAPLPLKGEKAEAPRSVSAEEVARLHDERLSRWVRKLDAELGGLIVPVSEAGGGVGKLQQHLVESGQRLPQTTPACVSSSAFDKAKKYRVTPATTWCGDAGWDHVEHFPVLRSKASLASSDLLAVCVSYNTNTYVYRFETGESACVSQRGSSKSDVWRHAQTLHTSKQADGEHVCVGVKEAAERSRWIIKKAAKCDVQDFKHAFVFRAMSTKMPEPTMTRACLVDAERKDTGKEIVRLAPTPFQEVKSEVGYKAWKLQKELIFLSLRQHTADLKFCVAVAAAPVDGAPAAWRGLKGDDCDKKKVASSGEPKVEWVPLKPVLYSPPDATGSRICLCSRSSRSSKLRKEWTWQEGSCDDSNEEATKEEFCVMSLSPIDAVHYAHLVDEPT